jgi:transcription initiation factor TFIID subunit 2
VRIQEADGRPYEHIVEIREQSVKVEFNYNTKYKRLKRTKRAKERAAAATENRNDDEDGPEDAPVTYALGDVLQGDQEVEDWRLTEWSQEDVAAMQEDAYEWIRLDKDFEWICTVNYSPSPNYMFVQQLQQDNDVVAQIEVRLSRSILLCKANVCRPFNGCQGRHQVHCTHRYSLEH